MFCPKCGNELPDTAAFCNACGATIEKKAPVAGPAAPAASSVVKKSGASLNPKLIGVIAAVILLVIVFAVAVGSCSSKDDNGGSSMSTTNVSATSSTTDTGSGTSGSGAAGGGTSIHQWDKFAGTWRDPDYGDTMELKANGSCVITQKGHGTTNWTWVETSDGIRIENGSNSYVLSYGYANGRETLYNNSKGLKFQR